MAQNRKRVATFHEGPEAGWRFEHAMSRITKVTRDQMEKRETEYQESRRNKLRPGPKPAKK